MDTGTGAGAERPRSRRTMLVGWATAVLMLVLAAIILLIQSPWNDPGPRGHKQPQQQTRTVNPTR